MSYLTIGSTDYEASSMSVGTYEIQEAFRNAQGDATVDIINTKRKIELSWTGITASLQAELLLATAGGNVSVSYIDPTNNTVRSMQCYRGDVESALLRVSGGTPTHYGLSFNLIEL